MMRTVDISNERWPSFVDMLSKLANGRLVSTSSTRRPSGPAGGPAASRPLPPIRGPPAHQRAVPGPACYAPAGPAPPSGALDWANRPAGNSCFWGSPSRTAGGAQVPSRPDSTD